MSTTLMILGALAPIGIVDSVYYHMYRHRLFERDESVAEQMTHLVRQVTLLTVAALLASGVRSAKADHAVVALFVLDLVNSGIDVLLEPASRKRMGGLPDGEYFLHFLGTFGTGLAAATYWFERRALPLPEAPMLQKVLLIGGGAALMAVELGLFLRARLRNARLPCCARLLSRMG